MKAKTPLTKRQANRMAKLERLLSTAMEMVGTLGLDAFSLHKLSAELGLTVGALYRYFPSKGSLIAALENRVISEMGSALTMAVSEINAQTQDCEPSDQALARLITIAYAYRQRFYDAPQQMRLISDLMANPQPLVDGEDAVQVVGHMMQTLSVVREAADSAHVEGVLDTGDAHERALMLWATLRGVAETKKLDRREFGVFRESRLFELTVKTLLCGWGAHSAQVDDIHGLVLNRMEFSP